MRLTVLGACGAWPEAGQACSGFLVERDGFRLLLDCGYAVLPRLLEICDADAVDAVYITHGHPDHCSDLNPLLRARALRDDPAPALPVWAPPGALDAVLALDRPGMLDAAIAVHDVADEAKWRIGPFQARARFLPHSRPNAGIRIEAGGRVLAYTGDCGSSPAVAELAGGADLLIADASYVDEVPPDLTGTLTSARDAAGQARSAGVRRLMLTHLMPGTDREAARTTAIAQFGDAVVVAVPGLVVDLT